MNETNKPSAQTTVPTSRSIADDAHFQALLPDDLTNFRRREINAYVDKISQEPSAQVRDAGEESILVLNKQGNAWPIKRRADGKWEFADNGFGHYPTLAAAQLPAQASQEAQPVVQDELRAAAQEFVDRVERGEVRSKHSYARFKAALAAPAQQPQGSA